MTSFVIKILKLLILGLRRFLPSSVFANVMVAGQKLSRSFLPSSALLALETTARRSLQAPTPTGGFSFGVSRHSVVAPENAIMGGPVERTTCDVVICCAFQGRHEILREIIHESLSGSEQTGVFWMLTGSTTQDDAFIQEMAESTKRVVGFICPNKPLGRKWQSCVKASFDAFDANLTAITGSDDILPKPLLDALAVKYRQAEKQAIDPTFLPALYATNEWFVSDIDPKSPLGGGLYRCSYKPGAQFQPIGAGRFYTRHALALLDGYLFDSRAHRLLDDMGYYQIITHGLHVEYYDTNSTPVISVKGPWSHMNSIEKLQNAPTVHFEDISFSGTHFLDQVLSKRLLNFLNM